MFFPLVISEHKKGMGAFEPTTVNQARIYSIAGTKMYAALGLHGIPIYVAVTEGPVVAVTLTHGEKWEGYPSTGSDVKVRDIGRKF